MIFRTTPRLAYALGQYAMVEVHYVFTPTAVSPIAEAVTGMRAGEESELRWSTCWPSDRFTRDDIDSPDVQRGFRKADIHPVVRSMVAIEDAALYSVKGQTRLRIEGPDPFLVGFASTYLEAARWVATGSGRHFLPWPVTA
jgi:hypothetical protein